MKKITNLLIVCSLALAGAVVAQQPTPEESQAPGKKPDKKAPAEIKPKEKAPKTEAPKTEAPKTEAPVVKEAPPKEVPAATTKPEKTEKKAPSTKKSAPAATPEMTKAPAPTEQPAATMTPAEKEKGPKSTKKETKTSPAPDANASTTPATAKATSTPATTTATTTPATTASTTPATTTASATPATTTASTTPAAAATGTPATTASASVAPSVSSQTTAVTTKKLEPAKVQQIRQRHVNFRAEARPERVPAVTFTANYRIQNSDRWQGPQYEVYRTYRPERHDQGYYRSKYQRVELIAGGYYYFHNNYWYPAWGYDSTKEYYAYDAPIYVGKTAEPPDKVIANVQAVLQEMGYYKGEVDGLFGPLTREALTGYQTDHGMTVTAVIDEPTLASLDMG